MRWIFIIFSRHLLPSISFRWNWRLKRRTIHSDFVFFVATSFLLSCLHLMHTCPRHINRCMLIHSSQLVAFSEKERGKRENPDFVTWFYLASLFQLSMLLSFFLVSSSLLCYSDFHSILLFRNLLLQFSVHWQAVTNMHVMKINTFCFFRSLLESSILSFSHFFSPMSFIEFDNNNTALLIVYLMQNIEIRREYYWGEVVSAFPFVCLRILARNKLFLHAKKHLIGITCTITLARERYLWFIPSKYVNFFKICSVPQPLYPFFAHHIKLQFDGKSLELPMFFCTYTQNNEWIVDWHATRIRN